MGAIYLDRTNNDNRQNALEAIKKRVMDIMNNKKFYSLFIFPEGLRTNGSHIVKFQKGAFNTLAPIKIVTLKYNRVK